MKKINISKMLCGTLLGISLLMIPSVYAEEGTVDSTNSSKEVISETISSSEEISTSNSEKIEITEETSKDSTTGTTDFIDTIKQEETKESKNLIEESATYEKYVTITSDKDSIYQEVSGSPLSSTKDIYGQTFYAKESLKDSKGENYLLIFNNNNHKIGYVPEKATSVGKGKEGAYQPFGKFATISSPNYSLYNNFSWNERGKSKDIQGKTLQARGKYVHFNGLTYLSVYDNNGVWYGYINENAAKLSDERQGIYQAFGKYATITNSNYTLYSNFSWNEKGKSRDVQDKTFHAKGKYEHYNGLTYLSLYDSNGKWYGYINEKAVTISNERQGVHQSYGKYVTVTNNRFSTYRNFSWQTSGSTQNMFGKTYLARGKYEHFNGLTYLSLFDDKGSWYGYVNANAVSVADGKQGIYQSFNKQIIINSRNYDLWQNFSWDKRQSSSNLFSKGYIAKGKYVHFNGLTYYSIYDWDGKWQGYINSGGATIVTNKQNPTTYYSQMSIGAWYGCAPTSLYTVLSAKGYTRGDSLIDCINGLPLSPNNPDVGQIGDPWGRTPFKQVISPIGLNNYAQRYTKNTQIITGSPVDRMITEINSGNYVLFWGRYMMEEPNLVEVPQHVMIAKGYKVVNGQEYILVQDPGAYSGSSPYAQRWFEKKYFDNYLTKKYRKMMVIR